MKIIYVRLFIVLVLFNFSCSNNTSNQSVNEAINKDDSIYITTAFVPPFHHADSIFLSLQEQWSDKENTLNLLKVNYAKTLIMTGQLAKADSIISQAINAKDFDTLSLAYARFANLKAAIAAYQQNQETSINFYKKSLQIFEKHKDVRNAASVSFNIANIFLSNLNYPMSYQYSDMAVKGFKSLHDSVYYPSALAVNAVSGIALGKRAEAYKNATEAEKLSLHYKNPLGIAMSGYALGDIAIYDKQYDTAIQYYQKIIPIAQQLQQIPIVAAAYTSLLKAYLEKNDFDKVIEEGNKAIEFTQKFQYQDVSYALNRHISQAYQSKGNEHAALVFLRKADEYFRDEVVKNDRRAMSELLVQYEAEKKDKLLAQQLLLIQRKNSTIKIWLIIGTVLLMSGFFYVYQVKKNQAQRIKLLHQENENAVLNAIMNGEEKERNRISKELHDGIAAMIGAMQMSLQSIPFLSDTKKQEQLGKLSELVSKTHTEVRRVAHDLLPLTLEKEGLAAAIQQFTGHINVVGSLQIHFMNELPDDFTISKRTELMLYRIVQELINNIMKHAQATEATILLKYTNQQLQIEITDNGIGISQNQENQGLQSIRERINTINGDFSIHSITPSGTKAKLVINHLA